MEFLTFDLIDMGIATVSSFILGFYFGYEKKKQKPKQKSWPNYVPPDDEKTP